MWSIGSELTLKLDKKSVYYHKIVIVLTLLSCYLVLHSCLCWAIKLLLVSLLLGYFYYLFIYLNEVFSNIKLLSYQGKSWVCEYRNDSQRKRVFSDFSILLKNGLFIVLKFKDENTEKICVVFRDQLTRQDVRKLMWIQKMQKIKHG